MEVQTLYQTAIKFAATKHLDQKIPDSELPYVVHLSNVAMEIMNAALHTPDFNLGFAVQIAMLHDVLEDTETSFEELENEFGVDVAKAVSALTKNSALPKNQQMLDSLERIKNSNHEVWAVKLSDRITNLQAPPSSWKKEKKLTYFNEAKVILSELKDGNLYLATRLGKKIEEYEKYI